MMKNLDDLIGEQSYMVVDQPSARFNFCYLVDIDEALLANSKQGEEYDLASRLPDDAQRAVDTMSENGVNINDFTGISIFKEGEKTYYILTWH
jgi:hypothetical protein